MESYIINPKTGKEILVNGPTYEKLLKSAYASDVKKAKIINKPARSTHQRQYGKTTKVSDVKLKRGVVIEKGNKMKGWGDAAPKRGKERVELKNKCGNECFLKPDSNGFPICAALRKGKGCKVDCRGIIAAQVRAGIWDYNDVHEVAMKLKEEYGC